MTRFLLTAPGPRPPFFRVAEHLWGPDSDYDSDGNSRTPEASDWTELTLSLRAPQWQQDNTEQRVDVDPVDADGPLTLAIVSNDDDLASRAAAFLHREAGGELTAG